MLLLLRIFYYEERSNNKNMDTQTNLPHLDSALKALKHYFGFDDFRPPQDAIIQDVIAGKDVLVLMPTGGGKSLCYQIPALLRTGIAIVVSPLIALMEDQVSALRSLGIRAAFYNSSLTNEEAKTILAQLHNNQLDLLYVAPERLVTPAFLERLDSCDLALFAIDEAHCISQWGHDFRPEYATLGLLKTQFPTVPIIALTATADKQTRQDIIRQLQYQPEKYIASFNRPNIHYSVLPKMNALKQIQAFLDNQQGQSGIVYCGTRKGVDDLSVKLTNLGYKTLAYHAGLSHAQRRDAQMQFRHDHVDIIIATVAFGMGIDKPDVRFVIHYDLPKNIEAYYQETGRAGRDRLPARALLLYEPADAARLRSFIANSQDDSQRRLETGKLNHMLAFAEATHCRRQILLQYFDEMTDRACLNCDICDHPPVQEDATIDAQKFLSCIYRLKQNYGLLHTIDVLRGSNSEKIRQAEHDQLSTFGLGKDKSVHYWRHLAWQLIHRNYCEQDLQQYHVLKLLPKAIPVLKGEESIFLSIPLDNLKPKKEKSTKRRAEKTPGSALFEALRGLRRVLANDENKPPFMIFSDVTLHAMATHKPKNAEEMLHIFGVGQHKLAQYGDDFIELIKNYTEKAGIE